MGLDLSPYDYWSWEWEDKPGIFEDWLRRARLIYATIPKNLAGYFSLEGIEHMYARLSTLHGHNHDRTAAEILHRLRLFFFDFDNITTTSCAIDGVLFYTEVSVFDRLYTPEPNVVYMQVWRSENEGRWNSSPGEMCMAIIDPDEGMLRVMLDGRIVESDAWEIDCTDDTEELGPIWTIGKVMLQQRVPVSIVWAVRRIETWWFKQRRERAARRIQRGLHKWLNAPVLRDGKPGIRPRLAIRHMFVC
jgi:hypothetical protein